MKTNPQIIITSIGTRWVNYRIILPHGNGSTEVRGAARINEPVDIPIEEYETKPGEESDNQFETIGTIEDGVGEPDDPEDDDPLREVERENCRGLIPSSGINSDKNCR